MSDKKPLTRRQIVILAKKYDLMPALYSFDKLLNHPHLRCKDGAVGYFTRNLKNTKTPTQLVVETLRIHQRVSNYKRQCAG